MIVPHPNDIAGRWTINTLGKPGPGGAFEIAAVRTDNAHGRESFGWADQNKVIVMSGHCMPHFDPHVWNRIRDYALEVADRLNAADVDRPKVPA